MRWLCEKRSRVSRGACCLKAGRRGPPTPPSKDCLLSRKRDYPGQSLPVFLLTVDRRLFTKLYVPVLRDESGALEHSRGEISMKVAVALAVSQRLRVLVRRAAEDHAARAIFLGGRALHTGELGRVVQCAEARTAPA